MENSLKTLFETRSSSPDIREEVYDNLNEETFGSMETWELKETLNEDEELKAVKEPETEGDSTKSLKEKELKQDLEQRGPEHPPLRRSAVDENDHDKDNMAYLIDSTLSHLGLGLTKQKQANGAGGGEPQKTFGNTQRASEACEESCVDLEGSTPLKADPENHEWNSALAKQKTEKGYRTAMSRTRCNLQQQQQQRGSGDVVVVGDEIMNANIRREGFRQSGQERGDADRVIIGAASPLVAPRRGSGRLDAARFERGSTHFCRRFSGPNSIIAQGGGGTTGSSVTVQGGTNSARPENFDLRNVETFGIDAVQQHIHDHPHSNNNTNNSNSNNNSPNNHGTTLSGAAAGGNNGGPTYSNETVVTQTVPVSTSSPLPRNGRVCSRYDPDVSSPTAAFGNERGDGRSRVPEIRDPRMYDFYMELWQKMQQEAATGETNPSANNSGTIHNHLGNSGSSNNNNNNNAGAGGNHYNVANDSRSIGVPRRSIDQRIGDVQFEAQMTELKHKVWEQLELAADLGPVISIMEDVFDRLVDPIEPPSADDRLKALQKLADNVSPENVCNLVRLVHSRRLLMYALAHLWSEVNLRDHVLELVSTMLRRLDTLLVSDGSDMIFAQKQEVFARIFRGCTMEQLISLTTCLLKAPAMAVESKLGLFFIGRILECAEDMEMSCLPPHWMEKCLPKLLQHLASVPRAEIVHELVGSRALEHLMRNMDGVSFMRAVHAAHPHNSNSTASY